MENKNKSAKAMPSDAKAEFNKLENEQQKKKEADEKEFKDYWDRKADSKYPKNRHRNSK